MGVCVCVDIREQTLLFAQPTQYAEMGLYICGASICLFLPSGATAAKFATVAQPAGDIDRLLQGRQQRGMRRANAGSATLSVYIVAEHRPAFTVMLCRRWSLRLLVKADAGRWRHRG